MYRHHRLPLAALLDSPLVRGASTTLAVYVSSSPTPPGRRPGLASSTRRQYHSRSLCIVITDSPWMTSWTRLWYAASVPLSRPPRRRDEKHDWQERTFRLGDFHCINAATLSSLLPFPPLSLSPYLPPLPLSLSLSLALSLSPSLAPHLLYLSLLHVFVLLCCFYYISDLSLFFTLGILFRPCSFVVPTTTHR